MSFFLAILTAGCWASGDIFFGLLSRTIGAKRSFIITLLIASWLMVIPGIFLFPLSRLSLMDLLFTIVISLLHTSGVLLYLTSIERGNAIVNGTIAGSFSVITVFLSTIFFHEKLVNTQILAIIMIVFGIALSVLNWRLIGKKKIVDKMTIYALITMLFWGIYFAYVRIPTHAIGWYWPAFIIRVSVLLFVPFILKKEKKANVKLKKTSLFLFILFAAVLSIIGDVLYNLGITLATVSFFVPIASSSPAFYVLIASFVYKDRITTIQKVGIMTTLFGIVLINFK